MKRALIVLALLLAVPAHAKGNDAMTHDLAGRKLYAQKQLQQAVAEYQMAIRLDPKLVVAYGDLGAALTDLKRYREAAGTFRKALALAPGQVDYHLGLAAAQYYLKDLAGGEATLVVAEKRFPRNGSIYFYQGAFALARGKKTRALDLLEKAVTLEPALKKEILADDDLAPLRGDPRFQAMMKAH